MPKILQTLSTLDLCQILQGSWHGDVALQSSALSQIITDSRKITPNSTFLALKGERFDGHDFLQEAFSQGANLVIAQDPAQLQPNQPAIIVKDCTLAFGLLTKELLKIRRNQSSFEVYAITGSNGKTTCKEMLASLCEACGKSVLKTQGNFNNNIGLPLTVLELCTTHDVAILEMGTNAPGEIAYLVDIAPPDFVLLSSIGDAHLEGFGSREGVAKAKGEIFASPNLKHVAMLCDVYQNYYQSTLPPERVACLGPNGAAHIEAIECDASGVGFRFVQKSAQFDVKIPILGRHNAENFALSMLALGPQKLTPSIIATAASVLRLPSGRLERYHTSHCELLFDAYNANPSSMRAALKLLDELCPPADRALILGAMAELGPESQALHTEIGTMVAKVGVRAALFVGGTDAKAMLQAAQNAGMDSTSLHLCTFETLQDGLDSLAPQLSTHCLCLIKGSRSMRLERVLAHWNAQKV